MSSADAPARPNLALPSFAFVRENWPRLLVTAGLLGVFFGNQGFRSLVKNWIELRALRREIAFLTAQETREARRLREIREGDAALERLARRELGFVKKGEIEYRFAPPAPEGP